MEPKEYKIKTIKDIKDVVTKENVDYFLADFSAYMKYCITMKEVSKLGIGIMEPIDGETFHWIDDGKNEAHIFVKAEK